MKKTLFTLLLVGTASSAAIAVPLHGATRANNSGTGLQLAHYSDTGVPCRRLLNDAGCEAAWAHKAQHGYKPAIVQDAETNDDGYPNSLGAGANRNSGAFG